jgi:hypothetical protein
MVVCSMVVCSMVVWLMGDGCCCRVHRVHMYLSKNGGQDKFGGPRKFHSMTILCVMV